MGISGHFVEENYAWKVAIVQNLCEYCWFSLCDFFGSKCIPDTLNSHTA